MTVTALTALMSLIWMLKLRITGKKVFPGGFSLNDWENHFDVMIFWGVLELILGFVISYFYTVSLTDCAISGALTGLVFSLTCREDSEDTVESA